MSRARRHVVSVSLFPFLAVLICIMGALVIILVLMVARVGDTDVAAVGSADSSSLDDERRVREQLEDAQWKRDLLEKSRSEKSQELANKRAELSHLEEHIQRLNQQAKELLERAKTIDEGRQLRAEDLEKARQELFRLQAESADKKKKLIEKAKQRSTEQPSYALIPYDGPNGTRRRPIYIECDELGITIQPEGIVFMAEDFQGPLGPGNPLDAALRTIRERLAQGGGKAGEPYPLLIVRPGGIHAYSAARTALKSWDDEFGYELIGDDKRLDYGEADPITTAALEKTVKTARQRQALLASAMPRKFAGGEGLTSFAGEPSGGGGGGGFGSGSSGGYGGSFGSGSGGFGSGSGGYRGGSTTGSFGTPGSSGGAGSSAGFGGNSPTPGIPGAAGGGARPGGAGSGAAGGTSTAGGGNGSTGASPSGTAGTGGSNGSSATGGATGRPSGSSSATGVSVPTVGYTQGQTGSGSNGGGTSSSSAPGHGGGTNQSGGSSQPSSPFASKKGGKASDSNSKSRLPNWAVPNARVNSIGVTRPIHVAVLPDRLVIVPEVGDDRQPQQFPISQSLTPQEVDAFVGAVQKEMKSWGLAVQNGFWRPQLIMDVSPQAEQQCRELQMALEGSGFDLQRKLR